MSIPYPQEKLVQVGGEAGRGEAEQELWTRENLASV